MLGYQSVSPESNIRPISMISLCSGKSCMPYVSAETGTISYVNSFATGGFVSRLTIIESVHGGFLVRVVDRVYGEKLETVYSNECDASEACEHVLEDIASGNHRIYSAESVALRAKDPQMASDGNGEKPAFAGVSGHVEFSDGIAKLLSAMEWLTGEPMNSKFSPISNKLGCSSNMPTLEKIVFKQAARHNRVRRPSGSKSFSSGMETDAAGGARIPGQKEVISRRKAASVRIMERAESALSEGKADKAEHLFNAACVEESKATEAQDLVNNRMSLLRERATLARKKRTEALAQAEMDANAA